MALNTRGYSLPNFFAMINGEKPAYLSSFSPPTYEAEKIEQALGPDGITKMAVANPKIGDAKLACNVSQANAMYTIMRSIIDKNCQEFEARIILADHNFKGKRGISMSGCMAKELSFPALEAKDGKKLFEATMTFAVERLEYEKGDDQVIKGDLGMKAKNWLCSNFEPIGMPGGIKAESVMKVEPCKYTAKIAEEHAGMFRLPTRIWAAWTVAGLKTEHSSIGFDEVKDLAVKVLQNGAIEDHEYTDWSVQMKDQTMKHTLGEFVFKGTAPQKFTWSPELKGGQDSMAVCNLEWLCEVQDFTIQWK